MMLKPGSDWLRPTIACDGSTKRAALMMFCSSWRAVHRSMLNNVGYHYILQGEYAKASQILLEAKRGDPGNKFISNNIDLVQARDRSDDNKRDH